MWLWLWLQPTVLLEVADLIRPLTWDLPYAAGAALKRQKKLCISLHMLPCPFCAFKSYANLTVRFFYSVLLVLIFIEMQCSANDMVSVIKVGTIFYKR